MLRKGKPKNFTHVAKVTLIVISIFVFSSLIVLGMTGITTKPTATLQQVPEEKMTAKQREHSRQYDRYKTGKKLREQAAEGEGDLEVSIYLPAPMQFGDPKIKSANSNNFLRGIACDADSIVAGRLNNGLSFLTESGEFIFTEYEMEVEVVIKNNTDAPIQPNSKISLSRPGGTIRLGGRDVRAVDSGFSAFTVGERYLLFLKYVPSTNAYRAYRSGSFQLGDSKGSNKVNRLSAGPREGVSESEDDATAFINEITNAVAGPCGTGKLY